MFLSMLPMRAQPWILQNVRLVDVAEERITTHKDLYIEGNRILNIVDAGQFLPPPPFSAVDGKGGFVIPGLWDMHVHPDDPEVWRMDTTTISRDLMMPLFVLHGVTGIRDMAGGLQQVFRWRKLAENGELMVPKIYACGPLLDGPDPMWDGSLGISQPREIPSKIDSLMGAGADFLKIYSLLPRDTYLALAGYATQRGFDFVGLVPIVVLPSEAAKTGMKSQEHLLQILLECSQRRDDIMEDRLDYSSLSTGLERYVYRQQLIMDSFDTLKLKSLISTMLEHQTWVTPTLSMWYKNAWYEQELPRDRLMLDYLPQYLRTYWTPEVNDHLKYRSNRQFIQTKRRLYQFYRYLVSEMQRAGVNILCGTDMGANPLCFPGIGVHNELEALVDAGLSPAEALRSATINPANFFGIEADYGTVAPGKIADLVILKGNPLLDVGQVRNIRAVIHGGVLYDANDIADRLSAIRREQAK